MKINWLKSTKLNWLHKQPKPKIKSISTDTQSIPGQTIYHIKLNRRFRYPIERKHDRRYVWMNVTKVDNQYQFIFTPFNFTVMLKYNRTDHDIYTDNQIFLQYQHERQVYGDKLRQILTELNFDLDELDQGFTYRLMRQSDQPPMTIINQFVDTFETIVSTYQKQYPDEF